MTDSTGSLHRQVSRRRGNCFLLLLAACSALLAAGCRPKATSLVSVDVAVEFSPAPPAVGSSALKIALADPAGRPLRLDRLEVEGNMNHAGMRPVFAQLAENEPGHYAGTIEFTMGGDWFLLLTGHTPDGRTFEKKIDVPGVRSK